jgi:hypothetical protein
MNPLCLRLINTYLSNLPHYTGAQRYEENPQKAKRPKK